MRHWGRSYALDMSRAACDVGLLRRRGSYNGIIIRLACRHIFLLRSRCTPASGHQQRSKFHDGRGGDWRQWRRFMVDARDGRKATALRCPQAAGKHHLERSSGQPSILYVFIIMRRTARALNRQFCNRCRTIIYIPTATGLRRRRTVPIASVTNLRLRMFSIEEFDFRSVAYDHDQETFKNIFI